MELNNSLAGNYQQYIKNSYNNYNMQQLENRQNELEKSSMSNTGQNDERLKELAGEFASILMQQMFKAMRETVPENKLVDGGFAEDVFTDMLDEEISRKASLQQLDSLSEALYQQLKQKQS